MLVYHVGPELYSDIRALNYQSDVVNRPLQYFREVNVFAGPVTIDNVKLMQTSGFDNWSKDKLYLYTINLLDVRHLIDSISVTSIPEEAEYQTLHWEDFYNKHKHLPDGEWAVAKAEYLRLRSIYLSTLGINECMSIEECIALTSKSDWGDMDKYFALNSKIGNKKQYASYIPHIQLDTKGPLPYVHVSRLISS